jgi:hypothetical protein
MGLAVRPGIFVQIAQLTNGQKYDILLVQTKRKGKIVMKIVDSTAKIMEFRHVAQGEVFIWRDEYDKNHYFIKTDGIKDSYFTIWNAVCLDNGEQEHFDDVEQVRVVEVELVVRP